MKNKFLFLTLFSVFSLFKGHSQCYPPTYVDIYVDKSSICLGDSVTLSVYNGVNIQSAKWVNTTDGKYIELSKNGYPIKVKPTEPYNSYSIVGTDINGCYVQSMGGGVMVYTLFDNTESICPGGSIKLIPSINIGDPEPGKYGKYKWNTGDTTKNIVVSPQITTTYTITGSRSIIGNCIDSANYIVNVVDCPDTLMLPVTSLISDSLFMSIDTCIINYNIPILSFSINNFYTLDTLTYFIWNISQKNKYYSIKSSIPSNKVSIGNNLIFLTIKCNLNKGQHSTTFISPLNILTTFQNNDLISKFISIYPNPTKQNVTITFNSIDKVNSIEILNTIGQTVYAKQIQTTKNSEQLDLSNLQSGIYFIKVKTENGSFIKKIVKD